MSRKTKRVIQKAKQVITGGAQKALNTIDAIIPQQKTLAVAFFGATVAYNVLIPQQTLSVDVEQPYTVPVAAVEQSEDTFVGFPEITEAEWTVLNTIQMNSSAYNSEVAQTSGNPFITASGARVHHGTVANNCLPFGTKVRILGVPDHISETDIFTVEDRMNSRYGCNKLDIWQENKADSIQFGVRNVTIQIVDGSTGPADSQLALEQ